MVSILNILKAKDVEIVEQRYLYEIFGTWWIVVGKPEKQAKLLWEGKDGILYYEIKLEPENAEEFAREYKKWGNQILWKTIEREETGRRFENDILSIAHKLLKLLS